MRDAQAPLTGYTEPMAIEHLPIVRALLSRVHDIIVVCDPVGNICFINGAVAEQLGLDADAVVGRNFADFVVDEEIADATASIARWEGRRGRPRGGDVGLRSSDGSVRRFHYRAQFGDDLAGPGSFVATLAPLESGGNEQDMITALIENADRVARISAAFLDRSFASFGRGMDAAVRELAGLEWLTRITVWTIDEGRIDLSAQWDASYDAPTNTPPESLRIDVSPMLRRLVAGHEVRLSVTDDETEFDTERRAFAASGTQSLLALPLVASDAVLGILVMESTVKSIVDDVAHLTTSRAAAAVIAAAMMRQEAEAELAFQARIDRTTGLSNRWAAQSDLEDTLEALYERHSDGVGIIGVDLDRFKLVNEALGHRSGDLLLAEVSDRLRSAAPAAAQLARLSADEFLIVVPDADSDAVTMTVAGAILDIFSVPFEIGGAITSVTARAGVVHVDVDDPVPSAEEVLRRVANTVDHAKRSGNLIEVVDPSDDTQFQRLRRIGELEQALADGELVPYFQAEWELSTGRVVGAEALLRWLHPSEGIVGPDEVIPLAESSGLIARVGRRVMVEACRQARDWVDLVDDFVLRVNVSARQLRSETFSSEVADVLAETGFPARALCLELTESTLLDDPARSRVHFAELRDLGVGLAIDDFGTGYSSILQLKELPLSSLKIDQRFVAGIAENASDRAIVEATLELARAFGVSATAEGVESNEQRVVLEALGCTQVQGFLFSMPETADELTARLIRS